MNEVEKFLSTPEIPEIVIIISYYCLPQSQKKGVWTGFGRPAFGLQCQSKTLFVLGFILGVYIIYYYICIVYN